MASQWLLAVAAVLPVCEGSRLKFNSVADVLEPSRPLFGGLGEKCDANAGRCVMVADSYGIPRAAYLEGRSLSPVDAALALLQDQYAVGLRVNDTRVTASNVHELVGVEPVVTVEGEPVALADIDALVASGRRVHVAWRTAPSFDKPPAHPAALAQLIGRAQVDDGDQWFTQFIKNTTSTMWTVLTDPSIITSFLGVVKDLLSNLSKFFGCLQDLPDKYRLTGIASVVKLFVTDPKAALKKVFQDWVGAPLDNLQGFISGEMEKEGRRPVTVIIGRSPTSRICVHVPSVGSLKCESNAGDAGIRLKGGSGAEKFVIEVEDHSTVCATRIDKQSGWEIDLRIGCHDTLQGFPVIVGRSTDNQKCISLDAYNPICSKTSAEKDVRLNKDRSDARFEVTMDRRHWTKAVRNDKVCIKRLDSAEGWEENLMIECHATAMAYDFSSIVDGSWKEMLFQKAWLRLDDLVSMPHMEVGKCVSDHVLKPLKDPSHQFAMLVLGFADAQVKTFLGSVPGLLSQSVDGLQADLDLASEAADELAGNLPGSADFADALNDAANNAADLAGNLDLNDAANALNGFTNGVLLQEISDHRTSRRFDLRALGVDLATVKDVAKSAVNEVCVQGIADVVKNGIKHDAIITKEAFMAKYSPDVAYKTVKHVLVQINDFIMTGIFFPLLGRMQRLIISAGNDMLLLLEGICGLIPEIGALICETLTTPLSDGLAWIQQAITSEARLFSETQLDELAKAVGDTVGAAAAGANMASNLKMPDRATIGEAVQNGMGSIPWVDSLVDKASALGSLSKAYGIVMFLTQKVFALIQPDLNEYFSDCERLREAMLPKPELAGMQ